MCTSTLHTNNNVGRNEDEQEKNCARANVLVCCAPSKVNRIFHCCCCFLLRFILSHYLSLKVSLVAYLLDNVFVFVCLFVCVFTVQLATGIVFRADMSNEIFDDVVYFDFDTKWTIYDRKKQKKKGIFHCSQIQQAIGKIMSSCDPANRWLNLSRIRLFDRMEKKNRLWDRQRKPVPPKKSIARGKLKIIFNCIYCWSIVSTECIIFFFVCLFVYVFMSYDVAFVYLQHTCLSTRYSRAENRWNWFMKTSLA